MKTLTGTDKKDTKKNIIDLTDEIGTDVSRVRGGRGIVM